MSFRGAASICILSVGFSLIVSLCAPTACAAGIGQKQNSPGRRQQPAAQAYWINRNTLLLPKERQCSGCVYTLWSDQRAALRIPASEINGAASVHLSRSHNPTRRDLAHFPQLRGSYFALSLPRAWFATHAHRFLTEQLLVSVQDNNGKLLYSTGVQTAGVLDDLYAWGGPLGPTIPRNPGSPIAIHLWAPTAQSVSLLLFHQPDQQSPSSNVEMRRTGGVWSAALNHAWLNSYYLFDVRVFAPTAGAVVENLVTDPYSVDLAINGTKSRITDVAGRETKPEGWDENRSPRLDHITDLSIYELHVRDFSIGDPTVPASHRGSYLAFTDVDSAGMRHLRSLADAGLKAVHLLPTFHFSGVDEDRTRWLKTPDLTHYPPDGQAQQAAVMAIQEADGYSWGYSPVHYLVPEGAYATNPANRIREYRSMVMALHKSGLRVIQDVVFNHTAGFGQSDNSVLDKIVPGYYNRLDKNGRQLTSTCCADTATEHSMMARLQQDAVLWSATQYKIDGFRFDLMNFSFVPDLLHIRKALDSLTVAKDGVDGRKIYLYGEGWEFGETAHNALGRNATQLNLHGTGIGSFNDRLRDAVRGGKASGNVRIQGFATGLYTAPNSYTRSSMSAEQQKHQLLQEEAWIRAGIAGNLRSILIPDANGRLVPASRIDFRGAPTGYAASPSETLNYVSAHDNQTLFDAIQIKSPGDESIVDRTRRQTLALSVVALAQGIPFFTEAVDLLRSKDMDSDSFNSGDWFNRIDWSGDTNHWGMGLPPARKNQAQWKIEKPLLRNPALAPSPEDIHRAEAVFSEFLRIRSSSPLFRMRTAQQITSSLHFLNTGADTIPGVISFLLESKGHRDGPYRRILVVMNGTTRQQEVTDQSVVGHQFVLHPEQQHSADPATRTATFNSRSGSACVPPLTTAVFVEVH
ncbi:MAG: pullulanase-type alpha-1,6-glucosidase [Acidobacteriota bacterium]